MSTNQKVFDEIFKEYKNSGDIQDYGKDLG